MRIVLWDIDGTLVNTGGAGMRALAHSVQASPGAARALERLKLGGMTDRLIARFLCAAQRHHEQPEADLVELEKQVTDAEIDRVLRGYLDRLRETLPASDDYVVLPGVERMLDLLAPLVVHALGTGNVEEGARLKLERGDLWRRFAFGGFGSDAESRPDMLRAAWKKANEHLKRQLTADEFVVVGDTPRDVVAAHEVGFACVAVASGGHSAHELAEHGADAVLRSLLDDGAREAILTTRR